MTKKLYDLSVKTGEYTDRDGETKGRYKRVGAVVDKGNGPFMMMDRTFNPAGVPGDKDTILISMFEPKAKDPQAPDLDNDTPPFDHDQ